MKVLFVAGEGLPYIKTGGLADVIGSLPHSLSSNETQISVILPLYSKIANNYGSMIKLECSFMVQQACFDSTVRVFSHTIGNVTTYFIENRQFFERDELYGYGDDGERFAFFQHAVMNFILNYKDSFDVVHCHDWHTGMIPVLGKTLYKWHKKIENLKYVYTIHNLAFQGNFPTSVLSYCFGLTMDLIYDNSLNFHDGISFMKGGIFYSDKVTTVSKSYAQEILTPTFGEQMDYILSLKKNDLVGIVNGIDIKLWNPRTDKVIKKKYNFNSISDKYENKKELANQYSLNADLPLCSIVSRLSNQKGINLIIDQIDRMMSHDVQLFVLGTGDKNYEDKLSYLETKYPGKMVYYKGYNESLAHLVYAASDFYLMPSYFEPCGISQLIAMRYGTLPIVREVGGLKDTVIPYNKYTNEGTGFTFGPFYSVDYIEALERALEVYSNKKVLNKLIHNAMNTNVSWSKSAKEYLSLYKMIVGK